MSKELDLNISPFGFEKSEGFLFKSIKLNLKNFPLEKLDKEFPSIFIAKEPTKLPVFPAAEIPTEEIDWETIAAASFMLAVKKESVKLSIKLAWPKLRFVLAVKSSLNLYLHLGSSLLLSIYKLQTSYKFEN